MSILLSSRRVLARAAIVLLLGFAGSPPQAAAATDVRLRDYVHTNWTHFDGTPLGLVTRIEQTSDGYLWVTTRDAFLRFDGMRFVRQATPCTQPVANIARAADGGLWLLCGDSLVRRTAAGQFVAAPPPRLERTFTAILADRTGRVWLFSTTIQYLDPDGSGWRTLPSPPSANLNPIEDADGTIWATDGTQVFHVLRNRIVVVDQPGFRCAAAARAGGLFVGSGTGIVHRRQGAPPAAIATVGEAADGSLWVSTPRNGIARVKGGAVDQLDGVASLDRQVADVFVDREDAIWISNTAGLHRFRRPAVQFKRLSPEQGQPLFVFVDSRDRLWTGGTGGARYQALPAGIEKTVRPDRKYEAIGEDERGTVWLSNGDAIGYVTDGAFIAVPDGNGKPVNKVYAFRQDHRGHLWALAQDVGVYRVTPGPPRLTSPAPEAAIRFLVSEHSGTWIGIGGGGVEQHFNGQLTAYPGSDPHLKDPSPRTMAEDGGSLLVGTLGGLERLRNGKSTKWTRDHGLPGDGSVKEIIADRHGYFWMMSGGGLLRLSRAQLDATPDGSPQSLSFARIGVLDGVVAHAGNLAPSPAVGSDRSGRLYFTTQDALAIVDPAAINNSLTPPPIVLESVIVDSQPVDRDAASRFVEPSRLQFEYTSLSLHSPELARFRYRLEGHDGDWIEAGGQRQVTYGTLRPGVYRFHVIGAGAEGVWNETGASYAFHIAPVFWRTWWFQLSMLALGLATTGGLYQLRVRQLTRQFTLGVEARVAERTRIARELHDTLLQTFQGVVIHFQAATNLLPGRPDEARQKLERALDHAGDAITEGRDAVQAMRESAGTSNDLPRSLSTLAEQLVAGAGPANAAAIRVNVEGAPRSLHPIVRDDVYRIASEAMRNAARHAQAAAIQVDIHYGERSLQLRIRDDGKGIDPAVLEGAGASGHWGLPGMRERAELIGGTLDVHSRLGAGTEVELSLPALKAYATSGRRRAWSRK